MQTPTRFLAIAAAALGLAAAGCGDSTDTNADSTNTTAAGTRTVEIEMRDNAYSPDTVTVHAGETVRFVFTNTGAVAHEAYIGDQATQDAHETEMTGTSGGMDMGGHDTGGTDAVSVDPGATGELTHTFAAGDDVLIGCHEPGHYAAGMHLAVSVDCGYRSFGSPRSDDWSPAGGARR